MAVGSQNNFFKFIIDTGSGTMLLNDKKCSSKECCKRKQFDSQNSPSYEPIHQEVRINYGKGFVELEMGKETIFFKEKLIHGMTFGFIVKEDNVFKEASFEGILGLSYPALAEGEPFFDKLMDLKILPKNIFALYLTKTINNNKSKLLFGGISEKYYHRPLVYHKVIKKT